MGHTPPVVVTPAETIHLLARGLEVISASRSLVAESHVLRERARQLRNALAEEVLRSHLRPRPSHER
jgi:hypothetical protein